MRNVLTFTKKFLLYDDSNFMSRKKLRLRQNNCDDNARIERPGTSKCVEVNKHNYCCIYENLRTGSGDVISEVRKILSLGKVQNLFSFELLSSRRNLLAGAKFIENCGY